MSSPSAQPSDEAQGMLCDLDHASPVLVIVFGGLRMRFGGDPPFEFFRILGKHAPVKKLFLRDHFCAWYHRGVRGYADDVDGIVDVLREIITESGVRKTVTVGSSAGGYGALLFGRLLEVDEAHAFGPQTFISPELRQLYRDRRFQSVHSELIRSGGYRSEYGDLERAFAALPAPRTRCVVHYGLGAPLDVVHARHLGRSAELQAYPGVGHNVARVLRNDGRLQGLVSEMIA